MSVVQYSLLHGTANLREKKSLAQNLREKPLLGSPRDFCRIPSKFVRDSLPEGSRKVIKGQVGIPKDSRLFAFVAAACFGWLLASEFGLASGLLAGLLLALLLLAGWECWWAALSLSLSALIRTLANHKSCATSCANLHGH